MAIFYPVITLFAFAILLAAWAIASGAAMVVAGVEAGRSRGRQRLIAGGDRPPMLAFLIIGPPLGLPTSYVGPQAQSAGFTLPALAFRLRRRTVERDWRRGSAQGPIPPAGACREAAHD